MSNVGKHSTNNLNATLDGCESGGNLLMKIIQVKWLKQTAQSGEFNYKSQCDTDTAHQLNSKVKAKLPSCTSNSFKILFV